MNGLFHNHCDGPTTPAWRPYSTSACPKPTIKLDVSRARRTVPTAQGSRGSVGKNG